MSHKSDKELIAKTHNLARYFVENPQISWVLLIAVLLWGYFGYTHMPQRKDPYLAVREAVAITPWPGMRAEKVEQLVTRKIEEKAAENQQVRKIKSTSRTGLSVVTIELKEDVNETGEIWDDIDLKLRGILDLPEGAGPIVFVKDFGDTAALMMTVASPKASPVEIELRAREISSAVKALRADAPDPARRVSLAFVFTHTVSRPMIQRYVQSLADYFEERGTMAACRVYAGTNVAVVDGATDLSDKAVYQALNTYLFEKIQLSEISPDFWDPAVIRQPAMAAEALAKVAGDKYGFRQLEEYTDRIARSLRTLPIVSKVTRWGVQPQAVYLEYSQAHLANMNLTPWNIKDALAARNVAVSGGVLEVEGKSFVVNPKGEFTSTEEIGDVMIQRTEGGAGAYLRDLVDMERTYRAPPENVNFFLARDADGRWKRSRAVTLAVNMKMGAKIEDFSEEVNRVLKQVQAVLPEDLIYARTSDQPLQVEEAVDLFMEALTDAVWLVVLVSLIGFWEWRSALLMALSIPITLAMTFGTMHIIGWDLQQCSIASLIIALGLLVDDPVVANDAIKREMAAGHDRPTAGWLGPTKLAKAIMYATITNCVAYIPFALLSGDTGRYLISLPIVVTIALWASRIASMSFIPFLGMKLLRPGKKPEKSMEERRTTGFTGHYFRLGERLIKYRWAVLGLSVLPVVGGFYLQTTLKPQFFPHDLSYLFYVDVWMPEDSPVSGTAEAAKRAEEIIRKTAKAWGEANPDKEGKPVEVLKQVTSFVGGGGPRFWFSVSPELSQPNYAQVLIEVENKWLPPKIKDVLQEALLRQLPGVRADVRMLESGKPIGIPVQYRLSGHDIPALRRQAEKLKQILYNIPSAWRVKDDWGAEMFQVELEVNPDKANLAGVTNMDVALSAKAALNGFECTNLREGRHQIPVVARLRGEERAGMADVGNVYVYSRETGRRVPLRQVSTLDHRMLNEKIARRNQFRTITVSAFPAPGSLPSDVVEAAMPEVETFASELPPGMAMEIGGEHEEQVNGFKELVVVLAVSVAAIYLALLFQFKNAVKPFIVFSAIPYGAAGAFFALWLMDTPFGFMAFLGVISLIGVIVSHVIVLFDFIEEKLEEGEDLRMAILDAGIMRLRPVLITVGATVIALFPLAMTGGPLWEPLCYAQIGGLTVATFITLLMVPVIYSIVAFDLKWVKEE